jgi:hypothetical protein
VIQASQRTCRWFVTGPPQSGQLHGATVLVETTGERHLLQVALNCVSLALSFERPVVRRLASGFLDVTLRFLSLVLSA